MKMIEKFAALPALALVLASSAHAEVDVSAITGVLTDVGVVAAAIFGVFVAIKASKFIRRAL